MIAALIRIATRRVTNSGSGRAAVVADCPSRPRIAVGVRPDETARTIRNAGLCAAIGSAGLRAAGNGNYHFKPVPVLLDVRRRTRL